MESRFAPDRSRSMRIPGHTSWFTSAQSRSCEGCILSMHLFPRSLNADPRSIESLDILRSPMCATEPRDRSGTKYSAEQGYSFASVAIPRFMYCAGTNWRGHPTPLEATPMFRIGLRNYSFRQVEPGKMVTSWVYFLLATGTRPITTWPSPLAFRQGTSVCKNTWDSDESEVSFKLPRPLDVMIGASHLAQ